MERRRVGQYLDEQIRWRAIAVCGLLVLDFVLVAAGFRWTPVALASLALVGLLWHQTNNGRRLDPTPWVLGRRGERVVADLLEPLRVEGFEVLHDVQGQRGNVDHVVVGPTGIFAIETKHWSGSLYPKSGGRLYCNKVDRTSAVLQAQRGAMEIKRRLISAGIRQPWVSSVLVSTKASLFKPRMDFGSVVVVSCGDLVSEVRTGGHRLPTDLHARAVEAILSPPDTRRRHG